LLFKTLHNEFSFVDPIYNSFFNVAPTETLFNFHQFQNSFRNPKLKTLLKTLPNQPLGCWLAIVLDNQVQILLGSGLGFDL
jgi:ABC-type sugar transport system permease subunit